MDMIRMRWPFQSSKSLNKSINDGRVLMGDTHLSNFAHNLINGSYNVHTGHSLNQSKALPRRRNKGHLDIAIVEATEIMSDGSIIPGGAGGIIPEITELADKIIIEVNTKIPSFHDWHDIVPDPSPPFRTPFLISRADDRIGQAYMKIDPSKIAAIVESTVPDCGQVQPKDDMVQTGASIADHIIEFLESEVKQRRLPARLLPIQSGLGNLCNTVLKGIADKAPFKGVQMWSEVSFCRYLNWYLPTYLWMLLTSFPGHPRRWARLHRQRQTAICIRRGSFSH